MTEQQKTQSPPGGVDPMTAFWRDLWARSTGAGGAGTSGMPGANSGGIPGAFPGAFPGTFPADGFSGAFTPEAMRRMQGAFFEAMAQYAEQSMRSPQFLEAMKRSMDQALQFRRQMDDFLKTNMSSAFEAATGGANSEVMGAIRQSSTQIQSQIARMDERLSNLEAKAGITARNVKPNSASPRLPASDSPSGRSKAPASATKTASRGKRRASPTKR